MSSNPVFDYIDIAENHEAARHIEKINNGKRIIPTFEIDGKIYTNPGIQSLQKIIEQ